jgi:hypothetical protein
MELVKHMMSKIDAMIYRYRNMPEDVHVPKALVIHDLLGLKSEIQYYVTSNEPEVPPAMLTMAIAMAKDEQTIGQLAEINDTTELEIVEIIHEALKEILSKAEPGVQYEWHNAMNYWRTHGVLAPGFGDRLFKTLKTGIFAVLPILATGGTVLNPATITVLIRTIIDGMTPADVAAENKTTINFINTILAKSLPLVLAQAGITGVNPRSLDQVRQESVRLKPVLEKAREQLG